MKNKLTCLLLVFVLLFSLFATACATDDPADDTPGNTPDNPDTPDTPGTPEDPEDVKILPNLPAMDFNKAEFHCLHWNLEDFVGGGWIPWEEIDVNQPSGSTLDDEVFRRNAYVEETYNAVISTEYGMANTEVPTKIRAAVSTGDNSYQMMVNRSIEMSGMWTENLFQDLRSDEMKYLDFEKPWWNQDSLDAFTFGDTTLFAASDMLILDKSETGCIYYSTSLARDHSLPNYYAMVEEGTWTWEALLEGAETVVRDLNGDDIMDAKDQWGSAGNVGPIQYLFVGSGYSFAELDEDGHLYTDIQNEEQIDFLTEMFETMIYSDAHANTDVVSGFSVADKFAANELLFLYYSVKIGNSFRNMEANYGILPIPKYDEYQEEYYHLVTPDADSIIAVPLSCGDTDFTSFMLEAISAESYYTVYPAFYDIVLMNRTVRDPESKEMLKLIFDTRTYDIGAVHRLYSLR